MKQPKQLHHFLNAWNLSRGPFTTFLYFFEAERDTWPLKKEGKKKHEKVSENTTLSSLSSELQWLYLSSSFAILLLERAASCSQFAHFLPHLHPPALQACHSMLSIPWAFCSPHSSLLSNSISLLLLRLHVLSLLCYLFIYLWKACPSLPGHIQWALFFPLETFSQAWSSIPEYNESPLRVLLVAYPWAPSQTR